MLEAGFLRLAEILQEAARPMTHSDLHARISKAIRDKHPNDYTSLVDVTGDEESGTAVYSKGYGSGLKKANYSVAKVKGVPTASVDTDAAVDVMPRTSYENCVTESAPADSAGLKLVESAACIETIVLKEAKADYEIKLIAPGKGASAFYPAEVLKRDGPTVFKAGTHVYLNHPTLAEESARPEGDVNNLAGVLTSGAVYHESHAKGPGLFARMKVFADHAQTVEEKAPHVGMSIRAHGLQESGKTREGVPVLKSLTSAESVDVVTKAGAGGLILSEAARTAPNNSHEGVNMDEAAITKLVQDGIAAGIAEAMKPLKEAMAPLEKRALRGDAAVVCSRALATIGFSEAQKQFVVDSVLRESMPVKDGVLDEAKLTELVAAEAKRYGATLPNGSQVRGLGTQATPTVDPVKLAEAAEQAKADEAAELHTWSRLGLSEAAAKFAVKGRIN